MPGLGEASVGKVRVVVTTASATLPSMTAIQPLPEGLLPCGVAWLPNIWKEPFSTIQVVPGTSMVSGVRAWRLVPLLPTKWSRMTVLMRGPSDSRQAPARRGGA
jgi:hypothetical protein